MLTNLIFRYRFNAAIFQFKFGLLRILLNIVINIFNVIPGFAWHDRGSFPSIHVKFWINRNSSSHTGCMETQPAGSTRFTLRQKACECKSRHCNRNAKRGAAFRAYLPDSFAQVSLRVTVRLKTGFPEAPSGSAQKYPSLVNWNLSPGRA